MRFTLTSLLATVVAACTLATAISTASADRLSSSSQTFRVKWANLEFTGGVANVTCAVTLEGSFHSRTLIKRERTLVGYITAATVNQNTCRETVLLTAAKVIPWNGRETSLGATIGQSLPWHVTYETFFGTLPSIREIVFLLTGIRFDIEIPLSNGCLATYGEASSNISALLRLTSGVATRLRFFNEAIPRTNLIGGTCPTEGNFLREGELTVLNGGTSITIRLI